MQKEYNLIHYNDTSINFIGSAFLQWLLLIVYFRNPQKMDLKNQTETKAKIYGYILSLSKLNELFVWFERVKGYTS